MINKASISRGQGELADLARSPIHDVKIPVAKNSAAGGDTLRELAVAAEKELQDVKLPDWQAWQKEPNNNILAACAAHLNTPPDILGRLVKGPNSGRIAVLNPRTPAQAVVDYLKANEEKIAETELGLADQYFVDHYPLEETLVDPAAVREIEFLLQLVGSLDKRSDRQDIEQKLSTEMKDQFAQLRRINQQMLGSRA